MKFTWIGAATFLLEIGSFRILTDPVFGDEIATPAGRFSRNVPLPDVDVSGVDLVCYSSVRPDHFEPAACGRVGVASPVLAPVGAGDVIEAAGCTDVGELACWESHEINHNGELLDVIATPADGNGYFFRHQAGEKVTTVYWTGDAMWSNDIRELQQKHGYANLLVQHLGAETAEPSGPLRSPDAKEAMQFVYRMQPNALVPVHHHTFSHYQQSIDAFKTLIERTIYDKRLRLLSEGESFEK